MQPPCKRRAVVAAIASLLAVGAGASDGPGPFLPNMLPIPNATGVAATFSTEGRIGLRGPFFQSLGTNGRACVSCHQPQAGWTITPENVELRFDLTQGTDPIFRTNDGSNSPAADVSTVAARRAAYSMLLSKGVIRVGIGIPANAEFELVRVDDPYGHASAARAVALPPSAAVDEPAISEHAHVGWPRDVQGSGVEGLHRRHDDLLRVDALRSR